MSESLQQSGRLAPNKAAGLEASRRAVAQLPNCSLVPDSVAPHYDAVATGPVSPSRATPFVGLCVLPAGTEIEVKSTLRRYSARRGRFSIRRDQHERLVEEAGVYLLVVTEADASGRRPIAQKVVPATTVDAIVADSWVDAGDGRVDDYAQRAWSRFFAPAEVER